MMRTYFLGLFTLLALSCGSVEVANLNEDDFSDTGGSTDRCADRPASFSTNVIPIFSSGGCSASGCHGSGTASGGLTLDGSNDSIYTNVTGGSRVNTSDPAESTLLQKPVGAVTHGGGKVFESVNDSDYLTIFCWITAGALND